jgi:hypothetical protein
MAADWTMKRGDRLPSIRAQLSTKNGPVDLTSAVSVLFVMVGVNGVAKTVQGAATIVIDPAATPALTAASGVVQYNWAVGDTTVVGDYEAEWEVMWPGNKAETFPQETVHTISVVSDRGGVA